MFCKKCGKELAERDSFCTNCGTKIITTCKHCGTWLDDKNKFCPKCGSSMEFSRKISGTKKILLLGLAAVIGYSSCLYNLFYGNILYAKIMFILLSVSFLFAILIKR